MTREEYQKCEWAANMYHDVVRENKMLRRMLEQRDREIRMLKDHLRYKTAVDIQHSRDDAEVFMIIKTRGVV